MAKNNFLLVDLNEKKTKKLAETITSDTSRKILNYLAEKEHETEANVAKELDIPISTVHYHLQKLTEAKLIDVDEYHYSPKGREVNHYKLANKYIIIAPKKISGLKEKLKGILPVGLIALGISAVIKAVQMFTGRVGTFEKAVFAEEAGREVMATSQQMVADNAPEVAELAMEATDQVISTGVQQPDIALWFLIGAISTILIYVVIVLVRHWRRK
ncbi:MAG: helix-turn-helix domain-containing protein [Nanoarchaeota archaeon]|nr:helix-turn-helix domain-containing protein [Nanoarchaeota archaeon]MBU1622570.1 helix-turn-helix domain-containing protein [Nanoarchaeota archaeon]